MLTYAAGPISCAGAATEQRSFRRGCSSELNNFLLISVSYYVEDLDFDDQPLSLDHLLPELLLAGDH